MANLATILEQELEEAFEVKNQRSLHRYVLLLTDNLVKQDTYKEGLAEIKNEVGEVKSDVRIIAETMKQGFANVDKRFEDMNLRFADMNTRFEDMNLRFGELSKRSTMGFTFMNIILGVLVLITVLFKFI